MERNIAMNKYHIMPNLGNLTQNGLNPNRHPGGDWTGFEFFMPESLMSGDWLASAAEHHWIVTGKSEFQWGHVLQQPEPTWECKNTHTGKTLDMTERWLIRVFAIQALSLLQPFTGFDVPTSLRWPVPGLLYAPPETQLDQESRYPQELTAGEVGVWQVLDLALQMHGNLPEQDTEERTIIERIFAQAKEVIFNRPKWRVENEGKRRGW